ncbi:MAG: MFS transporter [Clostridia bacterium]|nr:MFS transporter [Clostridia bacterium]
MSEENERSEQHGVKALSSKTRYVGPGASLLYVFYDVSKTFNIENYVERFIYDVLKLDLTYVSIINGINTIWDVVDDIFIGGLVDRTRTRFGKFKPFLVFFSGPGTLLFILSWILPLFFQGTDSRNMYKFIAWLIISMLKEALTTVRDVTDQGMLAAMTPSPVERTRLIALAELLSGFLGDNLPKILMGVLIDLVNGQVLKTSMQSVYIIMGVFTVTAGGIMAFCFSVKAKERVMQSVEKPSIMEGVKAIMHNRPLLLIALSEFLSAFSIDAGLKNYYMDVLGNASIETIVGIPGAVVSPSSYAYLNWARKRFSTKTLWVVGSMWGGLLMVPVFGIGSLRGIGKNGIYNKKAVMIPAFMLRETLWMVVWSIRTVIPRETLNEAMDYCEWKNGYRTEGMTIVAKSLASKLAKTVANIVKPLLLKKFGYDIDAGFGQHVTTEKSKYALFAMSTILPFATSLLSVIPKLMYNVDRNTMETMYRELAERRSATTKEMDMAQKADEN